MSAIRGSGFALGAWYSFGAPFGITFGVLSTAGQAVAYRIGIRPTIDYKPATRPRITRWQLLTAANRTVGYATGTCDCRRAESWTRPWRAHGSRRLLHALHRMDGRSCARETHGGLWRGPDSVRLHSSIRAVLVDAARCEGSVDGLAFFLFAVGSQSQYAQRELLDPAPFRSSDGRVTGWKITIPGNRRLAGRSTQDYITKEINKLARPSTT